MSRIRIANPHPGSARYTTASQAERYVRRKEAVIVNSELHFLSPTEQRFMQTIDRIIPSEQRASDVYVRGGMWWNGSDPGGKHCEIAEFNLNSGLYRRSAIDFMKKGGAMCVESYQQEFCYWCWH
jgi:hypothetical protein